VRDREACIDLAGKAPEHVRIHTFGIGSGCDEALVKGMAKAGRGCCSMVKDLDTGNLSAEVVQALNRACQPSLKNCSI